MLDNPSKVLIKEKIGSVSPSSFYKFPKRSSTITIKDKDLKTFKTLYELTGGSQGVGHGEIALQWLFEDQLIPIQSTDLSFRNKKIDVKSYPKNSFLTLGKWKENQQIRKIINSMFSCYNLINTGNSGKFNSELGFSTYHIGESIKAALQLTNALKDNKTNCPVLNEIKKTTNTLKEEFKILSRERERKFIPASPENEDQIVSESISDIIYSVVNHKLFSSDSGIGNFGYLINVSKKSSKEITGEIEIFKIRGVSKDTKILQDNFSVVSGEIKIKPQILDMVK